MNNSVGFVGLGIMGRPMAENLAKSYAVLGFDTQEERFAGIREVSRSTMKELAENCRVICLSLPSASVVEAVLEPGFVGQLSSGTLIIDLSTGLPSLSRRLSKELAQRGIDYIDAPVSGGQAGAEAGSLAIMAGASPAAYEKSLPFLNCLGKSVRVGDVGAGGVAKLVNNMIVGVEFGVIAEGFALARKNGLDPNELFQALKGGWAGSKVLEVSAPSIAARSYVPGGTVNMIQKDLTYAKTLAQDSGIDIPMTDAALALFERAQAEGWGAHSQPALFELWTKKGTMA